MPQGNEISGEGSTNLTRIPPLQKSWPASCSTSASNQSCCQRNGRWLLTTDPDRRTRLTTVDNTYGVTTIVLCLQQLWSDAKSNKRPY